MHPKQKYIDGCNEALASVRSKISIGLFKEVSDFINEYDEWGVGMELLIDQLNELEIRISAEEFSKINSAMTAMDLGDTLRMNHLRANALQA